MIQTQSPDRTYILQAMVSMAASDGDLHENELATIRTVYERITGQTVGAHEIGTAHSGGPSQGRACAGQLARERGRLTRELKETIVSSAYMVLLADGRVSARERKTLMDFVAALKISEVHRGIIFEDVERSLH